MDTSLRAASEIIKAQQSIIGPIAIEQAKSVPGLKLSNLSNIKISGDGKQVLTALVNIYSNFFGKASVEVCRDAIKEIKPPVPKDDLPAVLQ